MHRTFALVGIIMCAGVPAQTSIATIFGTHSNSDGGRCYIVSGATHAAIRTFTGSTANGMWALGAAAINRIGDVDGDGPADFAIGYMNYGALDVFSGATGVRIYRPGTLNPMLQTVCNVGDVDGDGRDDFVAYVYANSNFQFWLRSGRTGAPTTQLVSAVASPALLFGY